MALKEYEPTSFHTSWNETDLLGQGGFAAVRKCSHQALGIVAVKCYATTGSTSGIEQVIDRQMQEAKVLTKIIHKHIIQVYGITKWSNCFGVVMELVEGGSLGDLLQNVVKIETIPWGLRLRIAKQLADALCYLHYFNKNYSFVHGDLKPENILLTLELNVKLADFGSVNLVLATGASAMPSINVEKNKQHTQLYCAPEFLKNIESKRNVKMDVYSFAMIVYELITRKSVFQDALANQGILVTLILTLGQRPNATEVDDVKNKLKDRLDLDIVTLLEKIMKLCWSQSPDDRPTTDNVRDELTKLLDILDMNDIAVQASDISTVLRSIKPQPYNETQVSLSKFSKPFGRVQHPGPFYSESNNMSISDSTSIIILGGWYTPKQVLRYTPSNNSVESLPNMITGRWLLCAAAIGDMLFAIGGKAEGDVPTDEVECLDLKGSESWIKKSPMKSKRYHAGAATLGEYVYVCGGWNDVKICLASIECYKLSEDDWTNVGSLRNAREGHSVVAAKGKLFVFGGYDGKDRLSSTECFDPSIGQSTFLKDMPDVNSHHAASLLNGSIYKMGGLDGDLTFLRKLSRYDVDKNEWDLSLPSMKENRVSFGSCVISGKLYAIGGRSYGDSMVTIECFNEAENEWNIVYHLEKQWYRHSVVPV